MTVRSLLKAYGLWLAGVLSAALAAYLLFRSRAITYDAADELEDELEGDGLADRIADYLPAGADEID